MFLDKIIALRNDRTIYRNAGNCLKVFEKNISKAKVFTEAFNQTQAECAGVDVPSIKQIVQVDGKWAIVYDFIEGKSLEEKIDLGEESLTSCLETLVELQVKLHTPKKAELPNIKDMIKSDIEKSELRRELKDELLKMTESLPDGDGIFHGCFSPDNVIVGNDKKHYIIDWTHAAMGSIYAEAAATYLTFMIEEKNEAATEYLKVFGSKTGSDIKLVRKWLPVIAASKLSYANERERRVLTPWLEAIYFE